MISLSKNKHGKVSTFIVSFVSVKKKKKFHYIFYSF